MEMEITNQSQMRGKTGAGGGSHGTRFASDHPFLMIPQCLLSTGAPPIRLQHPVYDDAAADDTGLAGVANSAAAGAGHMAGDQPEPAARCSRNSVRHDATFSLRRQCPPPEQRLALQS